jgi:hypothetical protein
MFSILSRKRLLVAGAVAAITAGGAGGTLLASHATAAQVTAATPGQGQSQAAATPSPSPNARTPHHGKGAERLGDLHLVKVIKLDGQQLTVADSAGTQTTYTIATNARVVGPKRAPETLGSLKPGELIVIAAGHGHKAGNGATAQPQTPTGNAGMVTVIRDTGFVAA